MARSIPANGLEPLEACSFTILGLLDVAAELLKQMPVVRGQHGCRYNVPSVFSLRHCPFSLPGPGYLARLIPALEVVKKSS